MQSIGAERCGLRGNPRRIRGFPYAGRGRAVECEGVNERREERPRELHVIPGAEGWVLIVAGSERPVGAFQELGEALDAATLGGRLVRLVVHERKAS